MFCLWQEREWRHVDLSAKLGLSQTEVSFALLEFLAHGLKYIYPVQPGSLCRGMPTAHSAPPLAGMIVSDEHDQYVWPYGEGKMRGQAIEPLYESVPFAAAKDPQLGPKTA